MSLNEKQKDCLREIFKVKNDQKETIEENSVVENQPEEIVETETKPAKKGNMKRGKKA